MAVYVRFPEKAYNKDEFPEWTKFIWKCNELKSGTFGSPDIKPWWAGGMVEEYKDARVIFVGDDTVRIASKTKRGSKVITDAAGELGIVTGVA